MPRTALPRNTALLALWGGEFASRIGEGIFQIALLWFLLDLTQDSLATGLVTMVAYAPAFLVGLWAGVFVDRMDYRRVLLGADALRAALVCGIPVLSLLGLPHPAAVAALAFLVSSASAFFNPARDAMIPRLARPQELLRANSLVQSAWQFSLVIGPFLAAAALPFMRTEFLFFGVALAFLGSGGVLLRLPRTPPVAESAAQDGAGIPGAPGASGAGLPAAPGASGAGTLLADFRAGLRYLRAEKRVWWIWVITVVNNFFLMGPVFVGMPVYVRQHLGGSGSDFALVEGTYAAGMILTTWMLARMGHRLPPLRLLFAALIYDGLTYVPLYFIDSVAGTLVAIAVHSVGIPAITISRLTALHRLVPQPVQGRVFSYFHLAVAGMTALSIGAVGIVLTWLSPNALFGIIGPICAATGVLGLLLPVFRGHDDGLF